MALLTNNLRYGLNSEYSAIKSNRYMLFSECYYYLSNIISELVMLHQKAFYLQEMGITHWQVRKPALFAQGSGFPLLDLSDCHLLFVATQEEFEHPLTIAILKAFNIKKAMFVAVV
ncbi:DNA polymerase III subunit psi [Psychromonas sp. KJ10-10]|uniref:DNA polymerase III subunit psi n=1 Tax=Psychromonas sp. KJ10-10 TaxID=3391823 RepID=UPI0039B4FF69